MSAAKLMAWFRGCSAFEARCQAETARRRAMGCALSYGDRCKLDADRIAMARFAGEKLAKIIVQP